MTSPRFTLTPRGPRHHLGAAVVLDLTLDNPGPATLACPHPMRPGAASPRYTLTAPDGSTQRWCRADEAPGHPDTLTLPPLHRWQGELTVTPARLNTPGRWQLDAQVQSNLGPLDAPSVPLDLVPPRFGFLAVGLAQSPDGEVTRDAVVLDDPEGDPLAVFAPVRETNPRLGEGAAGPLVPRARLPAGVSRLLVPSARYDLGVDPQRWLVAPTDGGLLAFSNLHDAPAPLAWPQGHGYPWAALQCPGGSLWVYAHWGTPSGAVVGLLGALPAPSAPTPRAPSPLGPLPPGLIALAAASTPETVTGHALWAVLVCDASEGDGLVSTVLAWRTDPTTGVTVEAFRQTVPGLRPSGAAGAWSDGPETLCAAFLGVDGDGGMIAVSLEWEATAPAPVVLSRTPLGVRQHDLVAEGVTLWARRGVRDTLVWVRHRDGRASLAYGGSGLRPVRVALAPSSPLALVPGVDRWYAVHRDDSGSLLVDPA